MPGFPGFDSFAFPGTAQLAWLRANTNLIWCGYYLAPAPSHDDTSWMGRRAALRAGDWGIAPLYVGQQLNGPGSRQVTAAQGGPDGDDAARMMASEGFPNGSCVFLDLEDGPPYAVPRTDYVAAWAAAVAAARFQPGIYCSHGFAAAVHGQLPAARVWAFKIETADAHSFPGTNFPDLHPAGSGYAGAFAWQLGQNCILDLRGAPEPDPKVDLSTAVAPDPSSPG